MLVVLAPAAADGDRLAGVDVAERAGDGDGLTLLGHAGDDSERAVGGAIAHRLDLDRERRLVEVCGLIRHGRPGYDAGQMGAERAPIA